MVAKKSSEGGSTLLPVQRRIEGLQWGVVSCQVKPEFEVPQGFEMGQAVRYRKAHRFGTVGPPSR